ncbi:hypothetical protein BGZ68_008996 [Mortierella alpina]|nr:hypothetical protein BGZ68_008996 [Mortierella alpina]
MGFMLDYIPGNVVIRENDDLEEEDVLLRFHKRSTSTKVLDDLYVKVESIPSSFHRAFPLFRTEDVDEKQKLLRGHCTKIDVELIYPRGVPYPQLLTVNGVLGNVHIQLASPMAIFDRMRLDVTVGNIFIEGLSIKEEASFSVGTGKLQGSMRAIGEVNLETALGDMDVEIHPSLAFQDSGSENLNVTLNNREGSIKLVMAQRYQGHFSLYSGNKQHAMFPGSSAYPDMIKYSAHSKHRLEGWITEDGKKPTTALPRLAVSAAAGSAIVLRGDLHS